MSSDPFVVHVARLRRTAGTRWHEIRRGPIDPEPQPLPTSVGDSTVPVDAEVVCDVTLQSFEGGVMATGTVRAPWSGTCCRCTVPVAGELTVLFRERFADRVAPGEPEDEEAYPIVDNELDLRPMVRDAVLLELPLAPLCRSDCAGLCPECGADRNVEGCDCVAPIDPRWANLDALRSTS